MTVRPTFDICGIWEVYWTWFKTIIPLGVAQKVSFRLVPDQTPLKIATLLKEHLKSIAPKDIDYRVERSFLELNLL